MGWQESVWIVYTALGIVGFVGCQSTLLVGDKWVEKFSEAYSEDGSQVFVTGIYFFDLMIMFFTDALQNHASSGLTESLFALGAAVSFSLLAEASRRRASLSQAFVAVYFLLAQAIGIGFMLPVFLAVLNKSGSRKLARHEPSFQIHIMRAMYLVLCNLTLLSLQFLILPATAEAYPGGKLNSFVVLLALFAPCLPLLSFGCDSSASRDFDTSMSRTSDVNDRQLAHVLVLFNCAISSLVGLFVHIRFISKIFLYDTLFDFIKDMTASGPCYFLLIDYICLFLAAYVWLQVEAMVPVNSYFASTSFTSKSKEGSRLLTWRDVLAVLIFGPTCHFSVAFASREYGLFKLDTLKTKSS